MSHDATIRRLRQDDADAVRELDRQILGPDRSRTWNQYVERFLAVSNLDSLILPPWGAHVAEVGQRVVGFIFAERQSRGYGLPPGRASSRSPCTRTSVAPALRGASWSGCAMSVAERASRRCTRCFALRTSAIRRS